MLEKNTIIPVRMCASLGFHSSLFLIPNPGNTMETNSRFKCVKQTSISPNIQNLLRFDVGGHSLQFRVLPFGIAMAQLEFSHVAREVKLMLQNRGICIHQNLDDWLLQTLSLQICLEQSRQLMVFVQELDRVINYKKSELVPTQCFDFLRYKFDLGKGEVSPTEKIGVS